MDLRRSLTEAGVTRSVCDIVEKYVEEETAQQEEQVETVMHSEVVGNSGCGNQMNNGQMQMEEEKVDMTELRRSLKMAGITESVVNIVEKYTPGLEEVVVGGGQGGQGGLTQGGGHQSGNGGQGGQGSLSNMELRRSLKAAGVTESVVNIVEKYTESQEEVVVGGRQGGQGGNGTVQGRSVSRLQLTQEEFLRHSQPAQNVVREYVVDERELQGEGGLGQSGTGSGQGGQSPTRLRITREEYERHSDPAKEVVKEYVVDETQQEEEVLGGEYGGEVMSEKVEVVVQSQGGNGSPGRLRITREEFERHSDPAKEVVKDYVVDENELQNENGEQMTEEQLLAKGLVQGKDGRWGKCSMPAQDILEGYEPEMTV